MSERLLALGCVGLAAAACGTALYRHTIAVTPLHSATGATEIAVFDRQEGSSREWARRKLGRGTAEEPYVAELTTTAAVTLGSVDRARPLTLALAIPEVTDDGYFLLTLGEPAQRSAARAIFCLYGEYFAQADAPSIPVLVTARARDGDWRVQLEIDVGRARDAMAGRR